jgi:hypothetical protein
MRARFGSSEFRLSNRIALTEKLRAARRGARRNVTDAAAHDCAC